MIVGAALIMTAVYAANMKVSRDLGGMAADCVVSSRTVGRLSAGVLPSESGRRRGGLGRDRPAVTR